MYTVNRRRFALTCGALALLATLMVSAGYQVLRGGVGIITIASGVIGFFFWPILMKFVEDMQMMRHCRSQQLEYERLMIARAQLVEALNVVLARGVSSFMVSDDTWVRIWGDSVLFVRREITLREECSDSGTVVSRLTQSYAIPDDSEMSITTLSVFTTSHVDAEEMDEVVSQQIMLEGMINPFISLFNPTNIVRPFRRDFDTIMAQVSAAEIDQLTNEVRSAA